MNSTTRYMRLRQTLTAHITVLWLSGQCGKLMCCLRFENEEYTRMRKDLPKMNSIVSYQGKKYRISSMNVLQKQAKLENKEEVLFVDFKDVWPDKDFSND